jgi:hypothetical protein
MGGVIRGEDQEERISRASTYRFASFDSAAGDYNGQNHDNACERHPNLLPGGEVRRRVLTLTWPNVDLVQRTFTVQSSYAKNHETKTLPMMNEVYEMLKRRRADRDKTPGDLRLRETVNVIQDYPHAKQTVLLAVDGDSPVGFLLALIQTLG